MIVRSATQDLCEAPGPLIPESFLKHSTPGPEGLLAHATIAPLSTQMGSEVAWRAAVAKVRPGGTIDAADRAALTAAAAGAAAAAAATAPPI